MTSLHFTGVLPSGYPLVLAKHKFSPVTVREPECDIMELHAELRSRTTNDFTPEQICKIIDTAAAFFGDNRLGGALRSRVLTKPARDLLVDSLNFAVTGNRKTSLVTVNHLMEYNEVGETIHDSNKKVDLQSLHPDVLSAKHYSDIITKWIRQDNGCDDLLETIYLLSRK